MELVVVDKDIPFLKGIIETFSKQVIYAKGEDIDSSMIKDADALIIRTRTKCNESLLANSNLKFIASATIGEDHIDIDYCNKRGINTFFAKGCNSSGVMQYVFTCLFTLYRDYGYDFRSKTIGVIGVGNVGSKVVRMAEILGLNCLLCDPPKATLSKDIQDNYIDRGELLSKSDIVTIHTPLNDSTRGMVDEKFIRSMKQGAVLINSSRGEVVVDADLIKHSDHLSHIILDVWNYEPRISKDLVELTDIVSPHIAGYSKQGKINGSNMVINAIGDFFNIGELAKLSLYDLIEGAEPINIDLRKLSFDEIADIFLNEFPIMQMDFLLRNSINKFEELRTEYIYRNEIICLQN